MSKIPNTRTLTSGFKVFFILEQKSQNEIDNNRRTKSEERKINKIHPYGCGFDAHFFSEPCTNAKCADFKPVSDALDHNAKVRKEAHPKSFPRGMTFTSKLPSL